MIENSNKETISNLLKRLQKLELQIEGEDNYIVPEAKDDTSHVKYQTPKVTPQTTPR